MEFRAGTCLPASRKGTHKLLRKISAEEKWATTLTTGHKWIRRDVTEKPRVYRYKNVFIMFRRRTKTHHQGRSDFPNCQSSDGGVFHLNRGPGLRNRGGASKRDCVRDQGGTQKILLKNLLGVGGGEVTGARYLKRLSTFIKLYRIGDIKVWALHTTSGE